MPQTTNHILRREWLFVPLLRRRVITTTQTNTVAHRVHKRGVRRRPLVRQRSGKQWACSSPWPRAPGASWRQSWRRRRRRRGAVPERLGRRGRIWKRGHAVALDRGVRVTKRGKCMPVMSCFCKHIVAVNDGNGHAWHFPALNLLLDELPKRLVEGGGALRRRICIGCRSHLCPCGVVRTIVQRQWARTLTWFLYRNGSL